MLLLCLLLLTQWGETTRPLSQPPSPAGKVPADSEFPDVADGFSGEDPAVRGWYECTFISELNENSAIKDTIPAIRADDNFMMRALCTPQEFIAAVPLAGGYTTVMKAAMRPDSFLTDVDEAVTQVQDHVNKVRTAEPDAKDTAKRELVNCIFARVGIRINRRSTAPPKVHRATPSPLIPHQMPTQSTAIPCCAPPGTR